jgi:hypothetical protein
MHRHPREREPSKKAEKVVALSADLVNQSVVWGRALLFGLPEQVSPCAKLAQKQVLLVPSLFGHLLA